jgi:hypothetical protein
VSAVSETTYQQNTMQTLQQPTNASSERIICVEIPHQLSPVVNIWESPEDLLAFLKNHAPRCTAVSWRRVTLSEIVDDYGSTGVLDCFPNSRQFFRDGVVNLIERGNADVCELIPAAEDDDELGWYLKHHLSDNHWSWIGSVSEAAKVVLPSHQQIPTQVLLDEAIQHALN